MTTVVERKQQALEHLRRCAASPEFTADEKRDIETEIAKLVAELEAEKETEHDTTT